MNRIILLLSSLTIAACSAVLEETPVPLASPESRTPIETSVSEVLSTAAPQATRQTPAPPPTLTPIPTATIPPSPTSTETPEPPNYATLEDFWNGEAEWVLDVPDTGLPLGESDSVHVGGDVFWSYLHASFESAGVVDQCGDPVPFPGCTTLWKSSDGGQRFQLESPECLFPCDSCPCDNIQDHFEQQQYPRVFFGSEEQFLVYEFGAYVYLRTSSDGTNWSDYLHIPGTWIWDRPYGACDGNAVIGIHPHIHQELQYDCLVGGPPGLYVEGDQIYVFVAFGQAPGHMGCLVGDLGQIPKSFRPCTANPLFSAENGYGPVDALGVDANPFFEFRTISSADVVKLGDRYYMTYEGVRGPSSYTVVDDQFGLGLARSIGPAIDGPWERYPGNPIVTDLPGNVGLGHADLVIVDGVTYLYTATPRGTRGRYVLLMQ